LSLIILVIRVSVELYIVFTPSCCWLLTLATHNCLPAIVLPIFCYGPMFLTMSHRFYRSQWLVIISYRLPRLW